MLRLFYFRRREEVFQCALAWFEVLAVDSAVTDR